MMEENENGSATILVVDDVAENIGILLEIFSAYGYTVLVATSGQSALKKANYAKPDLILLDIMMPEITGFEVCQQLKNNTETAAIPVIFMTGLSDTSSKLQGFQLGAADYITKPIHHEEVLARVNTHVKLHKLQKKLQEEIEIVNKLHKALQEKTQELEKANKILQQQANIDGLTHIANRRYLEETLEQEWLKAKREEQPLSIALMDIDYFKRFNDTYGHIEGDHCLQQVAETIANTLQRPADMVGRYGGEEFMIILPNTPLEGSITIIKQIQKAIKALQIKNARSSVSKYVSLSIGINTIIPSQNTILKDFIQQTDQALYEAKANGRDQYVIKT